MAAKLDRLHTKDDDLNQVQRNVADALEPVLANPLVAGRVIAAVSLAAYPTINEVPHGLGRKLQGVLPGVPLIQAYVWDAGQASNPHPEKTVRLYSSLATTINLLVY